MKKEVKKDLNVLLRIIGGFLVSFPIYYTMVLGNDMHWVAFFLLMVLGLVSLTSKID
jgi:hypothetical protein